MSIIKSFSVGDGDMFYIQHNSSNFTIIDCYLKFGNHDEKVNSARIIAELKNASKSKDIVRFISTHPDEDHIGGLKELFENMSIPNFYCVKNTATKDDESDDFIYYCQQRDGENAFYLYKECRRRWMNQANEENGCAGISILWPDTSNTYFQEALKKAKKDINANDISSIIHYSVDNGVNALWFGDMEKVFLSNIEEQINWPTKVDILFAPHHGRDSGKISEDILNKIKPKVIVIGEADSTYLNYYKNWNTITQNSAGDIVFECNGNNIDIFVSKDNYSIDWIKVDGNKKNRNGLKYIGTI